MAAMIASRRALSPALLRSLRPFAAARSYNTNALRDDRSLEVERSSDRSVSGRRDDFPSVFGGVFDPFFPSRSLNQVLNLMDQMMENPLVAVSRGMSGGLRRGFDVREDKDGLYIRLDMPGLGKEHVGVSVEQDTLVIRGEGEKESEDEKDVRRYSSRIDLPSSLYKTDEIKAEMKNGVLKVVVPKVKGEDRSDVVQVKIE